MTAAKELDVISRLPDCSGEASDAVSAYTRVKMEDAPDLLRLSFLCFCGRHQNGWKEEHMKPMWKSLRKNVDLEERTLPLGRQQAR